MEFTINKGALLEALSIAGKAITKSIIPIMDNYLFDINGDKINITGSNMEMFITYQINIVDCGFKQKIAIPANRILSLLKALPENPILFTIKEEIIERNTVKVLKIKAGKGNYTLPIENGEDYPVQQTNENKSFNLKKDDLVKALDLNLFAVGDDFSKPQLMGLNIAFGGNKATYTGTNGNILSTYSFPSEIKEDNTMLIPAKVLSILQTLPMDEEISVLVGDRNIQFNLSDDIVFKSRLLSDKFPDYKSVIPTGQDKHLTVSRNEFLGALKRVTLFADNTTHTISLNLNVNQFTITGDNPVFNEKAKEEIAFDYKGDDLIIGLNGNFLITALNKFDADDVVISFSTPNRAILLRDSKAVVDEKENLVLLMPVMLMN